MGTCRNKNTMKLTTSTETKILRCAVLQAMLSTQLSYSKYLNDTRQVIVHTDENSLQSLDAAAQNVLAAQNLVNHAIAQWQKNIVLDFNQTMGKQPNDIQK